MCGCPDKMSPDKIPPAKIPPWILTHITSAFVADTICPPLCLYYVALMSTHQDIFRPSPVNTTHAHSAISTEQAVIILGDVLYTPLFIFFLILFLCIVMLFGAMGGQL